jgi:hypothetical protein
MVFLDHNDECPAQLSFDDIMCSYWFYQFGQRISGKTINLASNVIKQAFQEDPFKSARAEAWEYSFDDSFSASGVLDLMKLHPKYSGRS